MSERQQRSTDLTYMTPGEQARYASGEWLGSLECDNCDVQLEDDHECPITGSYVRVTK